MIYPCKAAVAVIPLLKGPHQESILQLLVSLAIDTLVRDALIHLLPHSLQSGHGDSSVVWKGFVATMTIIVLFFLEEVGAEPVDQVMEFVGHRHSYGHGYEENNLGDALSLMAPSLDDKSTQTDLKASALEIDDEDCNISLKRNGCLVKISCSCLM